MKFLRSKGTTSPDYPCPAPTEGSCCPAQNPIPAYPSLSCPRTACEPIGAISPCLSNTAIGLVSISSIPCPAISPDELSPHPVLACPNAREVPGNGATLPCFWLGVGWALPCSQGSPCCSWPLQCPDMVKG